MLLYPEDRVGGHMEGMALSISMGKSAQDMLPWVPGLG